MQLSLPWRRGQKKPWTSIPRINWFHPLAYGLTCFAYDIGGVVWDLAGGAGRGKPSAALGRSNSPFGNGYNYTGGAGPAVPLAIDPAASGTLPYTFSVGFLNTVVVGGTAAVFASADASTNNPWGVAITSTTLANWVFSNGGTADMNNVTVPNMLNRYTTLSGTTTGASNIAYANGVQVSSNTNAAAGFQANSGPCFNTFNLTTPNSNNFQGNIFYGAYWHRVLKPAELLQLHLDPYCFLLFPEDEIAATLVGSTFTWLEMTEEALRVPKMHWLREAIAHD